MRHLLFALLLVGFGRETPVLRPVSGNPATAWRAQLESAPANHGTLSREHPGLHITGTFASDTAHRMLRVTTHERFESGDYHYERTVELTIDGRRARLFGKNSDGDSHTSTAALPPVRDPEAPFGDVPNAQAGFTFAGDLRRTLLDCLTKTTLSPAAPGEWRVARAADVGADELIRRADPMLLSTPRDRCNGLVLLAAADGTLRGMRELDGTTTTFELFEGAPSIAIDDASLKAATNLDRGLEVQRAAVARALAAPGLRQRVRDQLAHP